MKKIRLDALLVRQGLVQSGEKARALILAGNVLVNDIRVSKPGSFISPDASIRVLQKMPYVSRGGLKLEAALNHFTIDVKGKVALDVGASTGGFTDCLLQHGAKKVYAVDVGYGQLAWELRNNPAVVILEKTNIRHLDTVISNQLGTGGSKKSGAGGKELEDIRERTINLATVDVSFISLLKVIPAILNFLYPSGEILALIKPQFEVGRKDVGKGGVVKDETKRLDVINTISNEAKNMGLDVKGIMQSPLTGPKGNIEYFIYLKINEQ